MTRIYALLFAAALMLNCATAGPLVLNCGLQDVAILASDYNQIVADYKAKDWIDLAKEAEKVGWATVDCVGRSAATKDPTIAPAVKEFRSLHAVEFRAAGVSACRAPSLEKITANRAIPGDGLPGAGPAAGGAQRVPAAGLTGFGEQDDLLRGSVAATHEVHTLEKVGSTPTPATRAGSTPAGWPTLGSKGDVRLVGSGAGAPGPFSYAGETVAHAARSCEAKCGTVDAIGSPGGDCICWRGPHDKRGGWVTWPSDQDANAPDRRPVAAR